MKISKILLGVLALSVVAFLPLTVVSSGKTTKTIVLTKNNTISLSDIIDGTTVSTVISQAKELDKKAGMFSKDPIYLYLRTPGGEIQAGMEMLEALKGLNRRVDTVTMFAASMGFQTVQNLGTRYIVKNGILMSHRARGSFTGEFGGQKPSQMDSRKGLWEQRMQEFDQTTVDRTKGMQTLESYQKAYSPELWLTGMQSLETGYADEVVLVQCDASLSGTSQHSTQFMGMAISYKLDNCPLNSAPSELHAVLATNKGNKDTAEFVLSGGEFGSSCLVASGFNAAKLCAIDTGLTLEKVNQVLETFKAYYQNIQNRVIPFGF